MISPTDTSRLPSLAELEAQRDAVDAPVRRWEGTAGLAIFVGVFCITGLHARHSPGPFPATPASRTVGLALIAIAWAALGLLLPRWRRRRAIRLGLLCPHCGAPLLRVARMREHRGYTYYTSYTNRSVVRGLTEFDRYRLMAYCPSCAARVAKDPAPANGSLTLEDPAYERIRKAWTMRVNALTIVLGAICIGCLVATRRFDGVAGQRDLGSMAFLSAVLALALAIAASVERTDAR